VEIKLTVSDRLNELRWGISHPNHPFEGNIKAIEVGRYDIWVGTAIEHAMHIDRHAATTLLEDLFEADLVADPAQLPQAIGGIDRQYTPDTNDHWNWEALLPEFDEDGFD
jgi:hypothetical protein